MNPNPSGDREHHVHPSSQAVVERLNPAVQQALGCLDIKLEDELARFRYQQTDRAAELQSSGAGDVSWVQSSVNDATEGDILTAEIVQSPISPVPEDEPVTPSGFLIINGLPTLQPTITAITTIDYAPVSIDSTHTSSNNGRLDLNFSRGGEITPFHDEYLASSQELLRQIQSGYSTPSDAPETGTQSPSAPVKQHFFTPVKLGSMAAACALAGGAVYTYLNPNLLTTLTASKVTSSTSLTTHSLRSSIQGPNLAANEFTELNLSTINSIKLPATLTTTSIANPPTATTPVAIPFNGMGATTIPPTAKIVQPRLSDSLVKSLLPANFQAFAKQARYPANQPRSRR